MPKAPKYQHQPPKKKAKSAKQAGNVKVVSNETLINFVLDMSGSMGSILDDTIGGFNTYIETLKADKTSNYRFSLTLFNTHFENRYVALPLKEIPALNKTTYRPAGGTALFDAIGTTVAAVEAKGKYEGKVLTVILTDGQENSSREYRRATIKEMIERKEKEGNWTFVFLGAGLDAFSVGDSIGIRMANSVVYDAQNVQQTMNVTAQATNAFSNSMLRSIDDVYSGVSGQSMRAARMRNRVAPTQSENGVAKP